MAVRIEFLSVIVPVLTIEERFHGGMAGFKKKCGEAPTDGNLVRLGTMNQFDLLAIIHALEQGGLKKTCYKGAREHWLDMCVVDRFIGPTLPCEWIDVDLEIGEARMIGRDR